MKLSDLIGGALQEMFDESEGRVLENILDPNVPWKGKRSIIMTIEIEPNEDRDYAHAKVDFREKLVPMEPARTRILIGKDGGKCVAEEDVRQRRFDFSEDVDKETGEVGALREAPDGSSPTPAERGAIPMKRPATNGD